MKYKEELATAGRFLKENDHFLVVNHVSPDGDATGSLLAMGHILEALGKSYVLVNEGATPVKFLFGPMADGVKDLSRIPLNNKFKNVISLDCGDRKRLGSTVDYFADKAVLLNIDHHSTNDLFGQLNVVRTDACATCEILFDFVQSLDMPLSYHLATSLYMGILTDTGGFRYSNTNSSVMKKAAVLLDHGVSPGDVAERCLETISSSYISLLQKVLPTLEVSFDGKAASLAISIDTKEQSGATGEDMEGIVNYARNIEGVEVGILFKQIDIDLVKISMRSRREVDVSAIAKDLGGGGHERAAGCSFQGSLSKAKEVVQKKLQEAWNNKK